jgi:hypothetical protein
MGDKVLQEKSADKKREREEYGGKVNVAAGRGARARRGLVLPCSVVLRDTLPRLLLTRGVE